MIDQLLLPLIQRVMSVSNTLSKTITLNSEEEREVLNLKRHYYIFVHTLLGTNFSEHTDRYQLLSLVGCPLFGCLFGVCSL